MADACEGIIDVDLCEQWFSVHEGRPPCLLIQHCSRIKALVLVVSLVLSYFHRATVLFTSLIKCASLNSVLNVVLSIILCHYVGIPGLSSQDTGYAGRKRLGTAVIAGRNDGLTLYFRHSW